MINRCPLCPVPPEIECRGLKVRRFCELIDPSHPAHIPGYEVSVQAASAGVTIAQVERMAAQALYDPMHRSGCCGGS